MDKIINKRWTSNSLFVKLFTSFLLIIILLVSCIFIVFSFYKDNIEEEIIKYNNFNLMNTVEKYDKHLRYTMESMMILLSHDENVNMLFDKNEIDYYRANQAYLDIQKKLETNSFLYVDNILYVFQNADLVVEKGGTSKVKEMFSKFLVNDTYDLDFWNQQHQLKHYKIYPTQSFHRVYRNSQVSVRNLMPIVFNHMKMTDMFGVVLIDVNRMFREYHNSINNNFLILDENHEILFSEGDIKSFPEDLLFTDKEYMKEGDYYYFYKQGDHTKLSFVNIIPNESITNQINKINLILIMVITITIAISIIASLWFSVRINNPIKKIIESIKQLHLSEPVKSNIKEFDVISENLNTMFLKNQDITRNLEKKNSLLKSFAYANKLKHMYTNFEEIKELNFKARPFQFILFDMTFKDQKFSEKENAVNFLREFIKQYFIEQYSDTITFQIKDNQVLTLRFMNSDEPIITDVLHNMKKIFDLDHETLFFTIAISPVHEDAYELTDAYEIALKMLNQRALNEETQIIESVSAEQPSFIITPNQEQELHAHVVVGNDAGMIQWVHRMLNYMKNRRAYASQYASFAAEIKGKVERILYSSNIELSQLAVYDNRLINCYSLENYMSFFEQYFSEAALLIKQKKEDHDHITDFVIDYLEKHYSEDIYLDLLADKLKISSGYLSSYFKEKIGMNFTEYLNEMRIDKAKQFLTNSNIKVQDIASKVGYTSINSFFRMFKKLTGVTPGEYRKNKSL